MATVEARSLTKRYDGTSAVDGIDLAVRESEFMVLLGPSGSGKTTLLRLIAGLELPTSGDVLVGGRVVTGMPPRAHNMAMVFQSYALYPHLTVAGNIAFPLEAQRMPREAVAAKVSWAAELFGIGDLLARKPRQLSGGERQRVALARAVVRNPVAFLLDEPLSNLDAKLRTAARDELQQLQRRLATTTLYVTHDQVEALALGDRVAVLDHGRVHQVGTPLEVYLRPADRFVATFVGSPPMNLVMGEGAELGFRPEHFLPRAAFDARDDAQTLESFWLNITRVEDLGAERLAYGVLEPPSPEVKVVSRIPCTLDIALEAGSRQQFAVRRVHVHRFDLRSGANMTPAGGTAPDLP